MSGRATAHTKTMKTINWEKNGKDGVNTYMESLVKETNTLYKVMTKHLPESTVTMVMQPIFKVYKEQWGKAFGDVVLGSEEAQKRMLRDAEYFKTRLGGLDGAGDTGDYIVNLVKDKPVPKPKAAPESRPLEPKPPAQAPPVTNGKSSVDTPPLEAEEEQAPEEKKEDSVEEKTAT